MIYEEPEFRPGGDRNLLVYLGDEMSFDLNFLVHTYAARIRAAALDGVVELIPELASLLVAYDPERIGYADLIRELEAIRGGIGELAGIELPSRLFYVPVLYFDPWTAACVDDYRVRITEKEPDPDYLVRLNGLADRRQLVRVHSGTEYWVAALGFWPGLGSFLPLDPRCRLTAPKYDPPRTWTPKTSSMRSLLSTISVGKRSRGPAWPKSPASTSSMCVYEWQAISNRGWSRSKATSSACNVSSSRATIKTVAGTPCRSCMGTMARKAVRHSGFSVS